MDNDKTVEELVKIRKTLENIQAILEYKFVPQYTVERRKVNGKTIRTRHTLEDPLKTLRKGLYKES